MRHFIFLAIVFLMGSLVQAQTEPKKNDPPKFSFGSIEPKNVAYPNWKTATFGGTQFWTDVRVASDWRIQRNSSFGHFRLLDEDNIRQAWGEESKCTAELEKRLKTGTVKPCRGEVVILLHGLCRSWRSMKTLAEHLETMGYETILFRYASSRQPVAEHARCLRQVIDSLPPDVTEINFVAHSLGNIVVRHYVSDCAKSSDCKLDSRINRMVMIGPPNQGSRMARLMKDSLSFKMIAGASGAQLSLGWEKLSENLATPEFEFGIIAGGYGADGSALSNPVLYGQDDFTVSKWETMLPGADDFLVKHLVHSTMMNQLEVLEATTQFLDKGYFISNERKRPIQSLPAKPGLEEVAK
ncbi:alpha/beta hydrolase [Mariniblastus fucicola]|uniref:Alpha/beta hydrolase family protein n=1 Tax=Mariniblastus fucicola TaxID=980251 RepID=A0A5B9PFI2_9BACT|nr:alpha/beta hydrolase [Mariniblastus fucicola]QEG23940.1 Alpha/beta hydrolase family protein [Mariniblastus fucicola]